MEAERSGSASLLLGDGPALPALPPVVVEHEAAAECRACRSSPANVRCLPCGHASMCNVYVVKAGWGVGGGGWGWGWGWGGDRGEGGGGEFGCFLPSGKKPASLCAVA